MRINFGLILYGNGSNTYVSSDDCDRYNDSNDGSNVSNGCNG